MPISRKRIVLDPSRSASDMQRIPGDIAGRKLSGSDRRNYPKGAYRTKAVQSNAWRRQNQKLRRYVFADADRGSRLCSKTSGRVRRKNGRTMGSRILRKIVE